MHLSASALNNFDSQNLLSGFTNLTRGNALDHFLSQTPVSSVPVSTQNQFANFAQPSFPPPPFGPSSFTLTQTLSNPFQHTPVHPFFPTPNVSSTFSTLSSSILPSVFSSVFEAESFLINLDNSSFSQLLCVLEKWFQIPAFWGWRGTLVPPSFHPTLPSKLAPASPPSTATANAAPSQSAMQVEPRSESPGPVRKKTKAQGPPAPSKPSGKAEQERDGKEEDQEDGDLQVKLAAARLAPRSGTGERTIRYE